MQQNIISEVREKQNLTQEQLAEKLGISREMVNRMEKGKANVSAKTKIAILDLFGLDYVNKVSHETNESIDNMKESSYLQQRQKQKLQSDEKYFAPFFPVKAQAGYVRARDQQLYVDTLEKFALPPGVDPMGAIWRYYEIEGSSMETVFYGGDIILTSQVHPMDWNNLRNFYVYVIVTHDVILIKRIFAKNELEWVLISENEDEFPQQLLPVEFVKEVWVFRRKIDSTAPPTKKFEIKV